MSVLVVYDSVFGNTAQVAKSIAAELEARGKVSVVAVADAKPTDLEGADLLVIGSPTRGFRPTPAIQEYVGGLKPRAGLAVACFDTRLDLETVHPAPLRWVIEVGGFAAGVMQERLDEKGCHKAAEPAGFLVTGTEGPLKDGEIERARHWAREVGKQAALPSAA